MPLHIDEVAAILRDAPTAAQRIAAVDPHHGLGRNAALQPMMRVRVLELWLVDRTADLLADPETSREAETLASALQELWQLFPDLA